MRVKQPKKSKATGEVLEPAVLTLTENDVCDACMKYVKDKGYKVGDTVRIVHTLPKNDRVGRKRSGKVEIAFELTELPLF